MSDKKRNDYDLTPAEEAAWMHGEPPPEWKLKSARKARHEARGTTPGLNYEAEAML